MKITCPHCKRGMSFEDEKLRDYLADDSQEDEGNQLARQTWIVIIVVAAAVVGMVGFGGGALLTSPRRQGTEKKIAAVRADAAKEAQRATQSLAEVKRELDWMDKKVRAANAKAARLQSQAKAAESQLVSLRKENQRARLAKVGIKGSAPATTTGREKPPIGSKKSIDESIANLLEKGVVHSVNVDFNEVRIDPLIWASFALETKQGTVMLFSKYFDSKGSSARVTVLSNRNDSKLATYGAWGGIKILQ